MPYRPPKKQSTIPSAHRPWLDKERVADKSFNKAFKRTSQEEIDVCLNCKRPACRAGDCPEVHSPEYKKRMLPVPDGFYNYYKSNPKISERTLAQQYNVHRSVINRWKRTCGLDYAPVKRADKNEILQAALQGMRIVDIKSKFHCSYNTIRFILMEAENGNEV